MPKFERGDIVIVKRPHENWKVYEGDVGIINRVGPVFPDVHTLIIPPTVKECPAHFHQDWLELAGVPRCEI